jgi:YVTN family beta-propeller protein
MRSLRILVAAGLVAAALALAGCGSVPPDVKGMDISGAKSAIEAAGLTVGSISYDASSTAETWTVASQSPSERLQAGDKVDLVLAGARPATVPDVAGVSEADAASALTAAGLGLGAIGKAYDPSAPASMVITQSRAPKAVVESGASVDVTLSMGPEPPPSDSLTLERVKRTVGAFSPKSIVASQKGLVFAQNMMYRHTISVFDDKSHKLVKTISDKVRLSDFGFTGYSGTVNGGPVEAAMSADGQYVYVSNYSMWGPGFSHPGDDAGGPGSGVDPSFVYRIPLATLEIDKVIKVGSVPKYLAATPDGRYVLVSNWISYTVSVIDTATNEVVKTIKVGRFPRGIAITPDSRTAYVAVMGSTSIAVIDLATFKLDWIPSVGAAPRHLVLSPEADYLYVTLNGSAKVAKIRLSTGKVVDRVSTGSQPRSMTIAEDGRSLYVVNYESSTMSKVRTSDMKVLQSVPTDIHPIGITYVNATREVWVSCYRGQVLVFADR